MSMQEHGRIEAFEWQRGLSRLDFVRQPGIDEERILFDLLCGLRRKQIGVFIDERQQTTRLGPQDR